MMQTNCQKSNTTTPDDSYSLHQLYFYLTGACNLRCRHCWIEPTYIQDSETVPALNPGLFRSIIDEALPLGLTGVKLTGGEPLLHPEIDRIIETARDSGVRLLMETNGTLCTRELARKIADCRNPSVAVSLDGCDAATHEWIRGRKGSFRETLEGIDHLIKAGVHPQIIMTIMRRNQDQMSDMVHLAERIGAGSIKFNVLQPTARGLKMHRDGESPDMIELISIGKWVDQTLSLETSLPVFFHQPPAFRPMGRMFGESGDGCQCCGIFNILGVLHDGSYALCGIGVHEPDLVFGQAGIDPLKKIWQENPVLQDIRQGLPERLTGICAACVMKYVCLGTCIAQNYYRSKDLWAPFWFCEEAHRLGVFPESRLFASGFAATYEGGRL
ncbi:MAG: SynChlorMet cassette radical SAM/SPASM protein ScmF [Syntrophales bacterium]|nr:SynChlorMet cassette radical SAM/SPASM protein ScmF [Syntrophales bacterium]